MPLNLNELLSEITFLSVATIIVCGLLTGALLVRTINLTNGHILIALCIAAIYGILSLCIDYFEGERSSIISVVIEIFLYGLFIKSVFWGRKINFSALFSRFL